MEVNRVWQRRRWWLLFGLTTWALAAACAARPGNEKNAPSGAAAEVDLTSMFAHLNALHDPLSKVTYLAASVAVLPVEDRGTGYQMLATAQSLAGEYGDAVRTFPNGIVHVDPPSSDGAWRAVSAVAEVSELAEKRQIVMVNEAHHDASSRALTLALLRPLRAQGYKYLAMEALPEDSTAQRDGYVRTNGTGLQYLSEPVFGEIVRQAVELGYVLVPYDYGFGNDDGQASRESSEAMNIFDRTFAHDPQAKLLVHAGWGHVDKSDPIRMVNQLEKLTGKRALSVDQTRLRETPNHPGALYDRLITQYRPATSVVLVDGKDGHVYSSNPAAFDVTVLHARTSLGDGRGPWLALEGMRHPVPVDVRWCKGRFPCLITARYAGEADDATPADRLTLREEVSGGQLYLAPGGYVVTAYDGSGGVLGTRDVQAGR